MSSDFESENESRSTSQSHTQEDLSDKPKDLWLLRPCEVYKAEYTDCKRFMSKIYDHYMFGQQRDCSPWLKDYNNCMLFRKNKDRQAVEEVIASERQRRKERLNAARNNDIWEYRTKPPAEWFVPAEKLREKSRMEQSQDQDLPDLS